KDDLADGKISAGHARALLALETIPKMLKLHQEIVARQLSVRQAERSVRKMKLGKGKFGVPVRREDIQLTSLKERLQYLLGTQVKIVRKGKKGRVEISFFSDQDLERILDIVQGGSKTYDARIKQQ
ncbi:MAG TPA: hypothetical protein PLG17_08000, partial [Thermodesulfobacteriota bacterium]|nr:hypothetical protein [Thermodesulfobacteriota bacterium]